MGFGRFFMRFTNKDWFWPVKITIYWDIPVNMYYSRGTTFNELCVGVGTVRFYSQVLQAHFQLCVRVFDFFLIKGRLNGI